MFQTIIGTISSFMYSKLLVILLIGAGVYFTIRTRFPQVRLFKNACGSVMEKPEDKGAISSFQALMVSTASRVGTGNIVGVSSAICIGGFGSVFWMWVIAISDQDTAYRLKNFIILGQPVHTCKQPEQKSLLSITVERKTCCLL